MLFLTLYISCFFHKWLSCYSKQLVAHFPEFSLIFWSQNNGKSAISFLNTSNVTALQI